MTGPTSRPGRGEWLPAAIVAVLAIGTVAVYAQIATHQMVEYDDPAYVARNRFVREGLTAAGVWWAFTTSAMGSWNPLVWLSHMVDTELFGMQAGPRLLVNLACHVISTCLLFDLLRRSTTRIWPSAFVAAAFALHPLHVESVAWLSERKDALSTVLWMGTLSAYVAYAKHPTARRYAVVVLTFMAGLMSKPMLVTLPFVLLLLDVWPLERLHVSGDRTGGADRGTPPSRLLVEKLPLLGLAVAMSVVTLFTQRASGARPPRASSFGEHVANAIHATASYLWSTVAPYGLAVIVPFAPPTGAETIVAAGTLVAITGVVLAYWRRHPALLVGWLWYLGTLFPVSGVIRVGDHARADRFTYVPLIGVFVMMAYPLTAMAVGRTAQRVLAAAAVVVLVAWSALTWRQIGYWRDSETLFTHALAVTEGNYVVHNNLGLVLERAGRVEAAAPHYQEAIRLCDHYADPHINLGLIELNARRLSAASAHFETALGLKPDSSEAVNDLGLVRELEGRREEAIGLYERSLRMAPDSSKANFNLGRVLAHGDRLPEAEAALRRAVELDPDFVEAHDHLGVVLAKQARYELAVREYEVVLRHDPARADTHRNIAFALAQLGQLDAAIGHWTAALRYGPEDAETHNNLAVALDMQGRREEAAAHLRDAQRLQRN